MEDIGKINVTTPIDLLAKDIFSAGVKILPEGKKEKRYCKKQAGLVR